MAASDKPDFFSRMSQQAMQVAPRPRSKLLPVAMVLGALGVDRAAIVGVSAGAPSAMQFALRHRDRSSALVLLVPAAYTPRPQGAPPLRTPAGTQLLFDTA